MFADQNPEFRRALLINPKATIERQLNISLGNVLVKTIVEMPDTMYVIVPFVPGSDTSRVGLARVAGAFVRDALGSLSDNQGVGDVPHGSAAAA